MVSALIPRVLEGQQAGRQTRGIIHYGEVVATRVDWPPGGRRSYYADVDVLGRGGRRHTFRDCATIIPVRAGDPVIIEMPYGDPRQGCFIIGRQIPNRPLLLTIRPAPSMISATKYLLAYVPHKYLGWPQAYAFEIQADVALRWAGDSTWNPSAPTPASINLEVLLETRIAEDTWVIRPNYIFVTPAHAELGHPTFHWSGIISIDDYQLNAGTEALRIAISVDATSPYIKWLDTDIADPGWKVSTSADSAVVTNAEVRIVELGSGTY